MEAVDIEYVDYVDESMLPAIRSLVSRDLSEPYSIYTYRYFLHGWPKLCICAYALDADIGERSMIATIVSKAEVEGGVMQGYIAMLAVDSRFRARGIGSLLVQKTIERMKEMGCEEIVLETEVRNPAMPSALLMRSCHGVPGVQQESVEFVPAIRILQGG